MSDNLHLLGMILAVDISILINYIQGYIFKIFNERKKIVL
jgi:hypothetical protein